MCSSASYSENISSIVYETRVNEAFIEIRHCDYINIVDSATPCSDTLIPKISVGCDKFFEIFKCCRANITVFSNISCGIEEIEWTVSGNSSNSTEMGIASVLTSGFYNSIKQALEDPKVDVFSTDVAYFNEMGLNGQWKNKTTLENFILFSKSLNERYESGALQGFNNDNQGLKFSEFMGKNYMDFPFALNKNGKINYFVTNDFDLSYNNNTANIDNKLKNLMVTLLTATKREIKKLNDSGKKCVLFLTIPGIESLNKKKAGYSLEMRDKYLEKFENAVLDALKSHGRGLPEIMIFGGSNGFNSELSNLFK